MSLSDVESEAKAPGLGFRFPGAVTTLAIVVVLVWIAALFIPAAISPMKMARQFPARTSRRRRH